MIRGRWIRWCGGALGGCSRSASGGLGAAGALGLVARREAEEECVGSWEAAGGRGTGRGAFLFSLPVSRVVLCPSGPTLSPTNTTLAQGGKQV